MSDLINFDGPEKDVVGSLPSPLIPSPENPPDDAVEPVEAGPHFPVASGDRRSFDNNPFDAVMKKVTEYERNKEDPFERVVVKAMGSTATPENDCFVKPLDPPSLVLRNKALNKTDSDMDSFRKEQSKLVQEDNDISIITDLNNTNLISDSIDGIRIASSWSCDKTFPDSHPSPGHADADLSILSNSGMDCSLLDHSKSDVMELHVDGKNRPRSNSYQSFAIPKDLTQDFVRRSLSVSDALKDSPAARDNLSNIHMSAYENPLNNAFRRASAEVDSSILTSFESRNSYSSVFSSLSNVSAIPTDSLNRLKKERFHSDNSVSSGISNLSIIPVDNLTSPSDSSGFCDTINKGFLIDSSKSSFSATTRTTPSSQADIIKKFYEIKKRMSLSQSEPQNIESSAKNNSVATNEVPTEKLIESSPEKLANVEKTAHQNSQIQTSVDDIISHEANVLAETLGKIVSTKQSNLNADEDLVKAQPDFDVLPPSDDETVDNLIELSNSPVKLPSKEKQSLGITDERVESEPVNDVKALEHEFIEQENPCKNAEAAALLLSLEKVLKVENNPQACKVLGDLQKVLGIKCDSNAEILKLCLQNASESSVPAKKNPESDSNIDTNELAKDYKQINGNECVSPASQNKLEIVTMSENESESMNSDGSNLSTRSEVNKQSMIFETNDDVDRESNKIDEDSPEAQDLASNLLLTLNQIVHDKNEDVAVDILKSLSTVLDMATKLRIKNKSKTRAEPKVSEKKVQKRSSYSPYPLCKSPRPKHLNKTQNKSLDLTPLRRSLSTHPTYSANSLSFPSLKEKRRSDLMNLKKRFPSDPGFLNPVSDNKKSNGSPNSAISHPSFKTSKTTVDPVKTKLKKSVTTSEAVVKKGPMKAVLPLGNMQKRESISQRRSVTPLKRDSVPTIKIMSSTPKVELTRDLKAKPAASSTPNPSLLTPQRAGIPGKLNWRNSLHRSFSTLETSPKSLDSSRISGKRMDRTMSPQRKSPTQRKESSGFDSRLPRYSPRPMRVRNHSFSDLKTIKSQTPLDTSKSSSEKSIPNRLVLSPLKNCNKFATTEKSNSVPRFKFNDIQTGPEKENYL